MATITSNSELEPGIDVKIISGGRTSSSEASSRRGCIDRGHILRDGHPSEQTRTVVAAAVDLLFASHRVHGRAQDVARRGIDRQINL